MTQSDCSWSYKSQLLQTTCSKLDDEQLFFLYGFSFSICRDFHFYASAFNLWSFSALVVLPSILVSGKVQRMSMSSRFGAGSWKNKSLDWGSGNRMQMSIILFFNITWVQRSGKGSCQLDENIPKNIRPATWWVPVEVIHATWTSLTFVFPLMNRARKESGSSFFRRKTRAASVGCTKFFSDSDVYMWMILTIKD